MQLSAASNSISLSKNSTPVVSMMVYFIHHKFITYDALTIQIVKIIVAHTQHSEVVLGSRPKWWYRDHTIETEMQERSCINVL